MRFLTGLRTVAAMPTVTNGHRVEAHGRSVAMTTAISDRIRFVACVLSGVHLTASAVGTGFLELGFGSHLLGELAVRLSDEFGVELSGEELQSELSSVQAIAVHLSKLLLVDGSSRDRYVVSTVAALPDSSMPLCVNLS